MGSDRQEIRRKLGLSQCGGESIMENVPFSAGHLGPANSVPTGACDCHVHVYDASYPVASGAKLLPPDASVSDYRQLQRRLGLSRLVLVTPSTYGTDNRCMLNGLAALGSVARGVAVIDGQESHLELSRLHEQGVRGVRLNLSLGVSGAIDQLASLAQRIAPFGWHLQLLMAPDLLASAADVLRRLPVPLVFDHMGRISPEQTGIHPAHGLILELMSSGRAWVKLSGGYIVSEQRSVEDPAHDHLAASYLRAAPQRVLWGSDWPHATASAGIQSMPDDARQIDRLSEWLECAEGSATLRQVLVDNPTTLYGF